METPKMLNLSPTLGLLMMWCLVFHQRRYPNRYQWISILPVYINSSKRQDRSAIVYSVKISDSITEVKFYQWSVDLEREISSFELKYSVVGFSLQILWHQGLWSSLMCMKICSNCVFSCRKITVQNRSHARCEIQSVKRRVMHSVHVLVSLCTPVIRSSLRCQNNGKSFCCHFPAPIPQIVSYVAVAVLLLLVGLVVFHKVKSSE